MRLRHVLSKIILELLYKHSDAGYLRPLLAMHSPFTYNKRQKFCTKAGTSISMGATVQNPVKALINIVRKFFVGLTNLNCAPVCQPSKSYACNFPKYIWEPLYVDKQNLHKLYTQQTIIFKILYQQGRNFQTYTPATMGTMTSIPTFSTLSSVNSSELIKYLVNPLTCLKKCGQLKPNLTEQLEYSVICSKPTFCYFEINIRPRKSPYCTSNKSNERLPSPFYYSQESKTQIASDELSNCFLTIINDKSTAGDSDNCTLSSQSTQDSSILVECPGVISLNSFSKSSQSLLPVNMSRRQRNISECSDESFICFVGGDDNDNLIHKQINTYDDDEDEDSTSSFFDSDIDSSFTEDTDTEDNDEVDNVSHYNTSFKKDHCSTNHNFKKVRFNLKPEIHVLHTWSFAYRSARKGQWEDYARDHSRFQQRIQRASVYLNPILDPIHRNNIYQNRFVVENN